MNQLHPHHYLEDNLDVVAIYDNLQYLILEKLAHVNKLLFIRIVIQ
jgi:hypothetical protein